MRGWRRMVLVMSVMACDAQSAWAQYRNNGIVFDVGPQVFEVAPYTVATVTTTEALEHLWGRYIGDVRVPKRPRHWRTCWRRIHEDNALPCRNDWFGVGDGVSAAVGFQKITGGFPIDELDRPFLQNLVVTGRFGATLVPHHWPRGFATPVLVLQEELGVRWNFFDEKFRPFVALSGGLATVVDPQTIIQGVRDNEAACRQAPTDRPPDPRAPTCVDQRNWVPQSPVTVNPSVAMWAMEYFPTMLTLRPEVGVERFVREDISVQGSVSAAMSWSPSPKMALKAPFAGISPRADFAVVFYF